MYRRDDFGDSLGSSIALLGLVLVLISAFLVFKAVLFVVRTFVTYNRRCLWIALGVCVGSFTLSALLYKFTAFGGFFVLPGIGVAELLITCLVVDLKNRDTLLPEKTNLINSMLRTSWWQSETPLEQEVEQLAA